MEEKSETVIKVYLQIQTEPKSSELRLSETVNMYSTLVFLEVEVCFMS